MANMDFPQVFMLTAVIARAASDREVSIEEMSQISRAAIAAFGSDPSEIVLYDMRDPKFDGTRAVLRSIGETGLVTLEHALLGGPEALRAAGIDTSKGIKLPGREKGAEPKKDALGIIGALAGAVSPKLGGK